MKIYLVTLPILLLTCIGCKQTETETVSPLTLQTHFFNGLNEVRNVFPLSDNTFVALVQDRSNNFSVFYKYNAQLHLIDSLKIPGFYYSRPVFEEDNSFIIVGDYTEGLNTGISVVKIDINLNLVKKRYLEGLYFNPSGWSRYESRVTKLSNGNYVLANTYEVYPKDKILMFCVKDIFKDFVVQWRVNPAVADGKWIESISADHNGNFYVTSTDHAGYTSNFINKFDSMGNQIFQKSFPQYINYCPLNMRLEDQRLIFNDYRYLHILDTSGNPISEIPLNNGDNLYASPLVKKNGYYFYTCDFWSSDGKFIQVRKTNNELQQVKAENYGNRGTNTEGAWDRFLVELSSGEMVLVSLVENPGASGNHWLLLKFDEELILKE